MKAHIIRFDPAQILCLRKFWFLSYKPKYSQPYILAGFLNQLSQEKLMNQHAFRHA